MQNGESFIQMKYNDFVDVAVHEIGHALGLVHSNEWGSVMFPFARRHLDSNGNIPPVTLSESDIRNIQDIYGKI